MRKGGEKCVRRPRRYSTVSVPGLNARGFSVRQMRESKFVMSPSRSRSSVPSESTRTFAR